MKENTFFSRLFGKKETAGEVIVSPITGEVLPIEEVQDATFAQKLLGDGLAVLPTEGKLYAPAAGTVQGLQKKTGHALCITTPSGVELLLHIGRDTVRMEGRGFTVHCEEGQNVAQGDLLIEFDIEAIKAEGYDTASPIIVLNTDDYDFESRAAKGPITHGEVLYTLKKK
ncbi:PTS system, glucose subfamily, IIA component [uncultured Eubacteriales bacterium]|uniref:PTS system, glucose subfamily, IIA component n=1 Tax=uncultured Eubacteriales bacterium TaxID=172733 RepID=A0A212K445_9FIRM|nr:PTS system, glucose subfamily, IIA component [uncultured Eubacteriales bacterium]